MDFHGFFHGSVDFFFFFTMSDDAQQSMSNAASETANAASVHAVPAVSVHSVDNSGMGPFDSIGAALGVDPFAVLIFTSAVVGFVLLLLMLSLSSSGSQKGRRGKTILLLGHIGSGKTVLLNQLCYGSCPDTVTSMKVTEKRSPVARVAQSQVHLVDVPGHPRTRGEWKAFADDIAGIVFVVDSVNVCVRNAAEYLAEILTDRTVDMLQPPILVACNKSRLKGAKSTGKIKELLEGELDQLKETRSSLESTSNEAGEPLMLGMAGKTFSFDVDSPCEVTFSACSAKKGGIHLEAVQDFISESLSSE